MTDTSVIEYEMGYRADEFGNVLNGSFSGEKSPYRCEGIAPNHWRISLAGKTILLDIQVSEKPPRKLGLFVLPVLQVRFHIKHSDEDQQAQFFDRFFKYFHKGGG
ncbi:MAG: hypothetical protein IIB69_03560 [Proteobacteria bacterium]|nr:hypothetical protein [Pseudomonadota bacterium]MCH8176845.1 hypothetical protein [Pseudomonadota bacterium]